MSTMQNSTYSHLNAGRGIRSHTNSDRQFVSTPYNYFGHSCAIRTTRTCRKKIDRHFFLQLDLVKITIFTCCMLCDRSQCWESLFSSSSNILQVQYVFLVSYLGIGYKWLQFGIIIQIADSIMTTFQISRYNHLSAGRGIRSRTNCDRNLISTLYNYFGHPCALAPQKR